MARSFCKTWWGNAWLQALSNIDYSNRIPRGARYARNGSVKRVVFEDNLTLIPQHYNLTLFISS